MGGAAEPILCWSEDVLGCCTERRRFVWSSERKFMGGAAEPIPCVGMPGMWEFGFFFFGFFLSPLIFFFFFFQKNYKKK